jgi:hypothetical protein
MYSLEEEQLKDVYEWVDSFTLSKTKRNIARDFSDGVLVAEILKQYFPEQVDLHSYTSCNSSTKKAKNWHHLKKKIFLKVRVVYSMQLALLMIMRISCVCSII